MSTLVTRKSSTGGPWCVRCTCGVTVSEEPLCISGDWIKKRSNLKANLIIMKLQKHGPKLSAGHCHVVLIDIYSNVCRHSCTSACIRCLFKQSYVCCLATCYESDYLLRIALLTAYSL